MLDIRYEILDKNSPLKRGGWCVLGIVVILFISSCSTEPQQKTKPKKPIVAIENAIGRPRVIRTITSIKPNIHTNMLTNFVIHFLLKFFD